MRFWKSLVVASLAWSAQADTGSISGTVTDFTGAVIAGAKVGLAGAADPAERSTDSGTFAISELQPGIYKLKFQAPGFTDRELDVVVEANVETRILVVLEVKPIAGCDSPPATLPAIVLEKLRSSNRVRISGFVSLGAAGLAGVSVTLRPADGSLLTAFTLSDEKGAYQIEGVSPSLYQLVFEKSGHVPVIVSNVRTQKGYETKLSPVKMQTSFIICL